MFSTPNWLDHKLSTLSPAHPTQPPQSQLESENAHQCTHHALLPNTSPPPLHPASRLPLDKHCHHKPAEARPGGLGSIALQTTAHTLPYSQLIGLSEASSGCIVYGALFCLTFHGSALLHPTSAKPRDLNLKSHPVVERA